MERLGNFEQGPRILCGHQKQCPSRARRRATPLFPFLQRAYRYAKECGKLRLRKTGTFTDRGYRRNIYDSPDLATLKLAQACQDFHSDVSLCTSLSHQFHL